MIIVSVSIFSFTVPSEKKSIGVNHTIEYIKQHIKMFELSTFKLEEAIKLINVGDFNSILKAKQALKQCRLEFKTIEFFLSYFLRSATLVYNEANKYEVEEPYLEAREPAGLQVIESLIYNENSAESKIKLLQQANLLYTSAADLNALMFNLVIDDKRILESLQIELIRVMTLGITGFDAPNLKTAIIESRQALISIKENMAPYLSSKSPEADSVSWYLKETINLLDSSTDFNSFDRLNFYTKATLPLQFHINELIKKAKLIYNTNRSINTDSRNLFSKNAIQIGLHSGNNKALIDLGKRLFFEKVLSENAKISCKDCHQPEKYFTDGLPKSSTIDGQSFVARNAPSLLYSTFQYAQFLDGRAKNIEEQIREVLNNPNEMGSNHKQAIARLSKMKVYQDNFKKSFQKSNDQSVSLHNVSIAITAYLASLAPMNSPFDQYISGNTSKLNTSQIKGFNLFMGKAQCGTCHFAPIFNGLIPPYYNRTEYEVLGLTIDTNFVQPKMDNDNGRFNRFQILYYKGAFKTPTLRNVAKTAPYMHNGAFPSLEKVMDFYNKGGAAGMGLHFPTQTLSSETLNLLPKEIEDIIQFLHSLTDSIPKALSHS